jgi:YD repeat-containing protein
MTDIVERLRSVTDLQRETEQSSYEQDDELAVEAADTIERLTAENEKLGRDYQSARDAHDKVLAENERLRTALKPFADESLRFLPQHDFGVLKRRDCDAARAALSGDKQ